MNTTFPIGFRARAGVFKPVRLSNCCHARMKIITRRYRQGVTGTFEGCSRCSSQAAATWFPDSPRLAIERWMGDVAKHIAAGGPAPYE